MIPEFHKFFSLSPRSLMEFELVVQKRNGLVRVMCPGLPNCIAEGFTMKEAMDRIADKIARSISLRIRREVREQIMEMSAHLPENLPHFPVPGIFGLSLGRIPLSLN